MIQYPIQLFIADDHAVVREGIKLIFDKETDIQVVGEAENGIEAYHKIIELEPDIVLLDISMPDQNGLDLAGELLRYSSKIKIIILSMYSDDAYVIKAIQNGVSGFLLKQSDVPTLIEAVRTVNDGRPFFSQSVSSAVIKATQMALRGDKDSLGHDLEILTSRERQILELISKGMNSKAISEKLFISEHTVNRHRQNIMNKLNIHNAVDLARFGVKEGLDIEEIKKTDTKSFHFTIKSKVYLFPDSVGRKILEIKGRKSFMKHLGYSSSDIDDIFQLGVKYDSISDHPYLSILGKKEQEEIKTGEAAMTLLYDQTKNMTIEHSTRIKNRTFIHKKGMKIPSVTNDFFSWEDMKAIQQIRFRDSIDQDE